VYLLGWLAIRFIGMSGGLRSCGSYVGVHHCTPPVSRCAGLYVNVVHRGFVNYRSLSVSHVVISPVGGRSAAMLVVIVVVVYAHSIITVYGGVWSLLHRSRYGKSFIAFIPAFLMLCGIEHLRVCFAPRNSSLL